MKKMLFIETKDIAIYSVEDLPDYQMKFIKESIKNYFEYTFEIDEEEDEDGEEFIKTITDFYKEQLKLYKERKA